MNRKTSEVLMEAQELIRDPGKWCKHYRDNGQGQRCYAGAVGKIIGDDTSAVYDSTPVKVLNCVAPAVREGAQAAIDLNDCHGHSATMEMFDIAISAAMSDEAVE